MQEKIAFNYGWSYKPAFTPQDTACTPACEGFVTVDLPHTNKLLPYNYLDERDYQFVSCYKKAFTLPERLSEKQVLLDFEGVMLAAEVYCNGSLVCSHAGGYTPFTADLTPVAKPGENMVVVKVDSTERPDIPPFGGVVDYLTYGGIYREVQLRIADRTRLQRLWLSCPDPLAETKTLVCGCDLTAAAAGQLQLKITLADAEGRVVAGAAEGISAAAGEGRYTISLAGLRNIALWTLDAPVLYTVTAELSGGTEDACTQRFGFRKAEFTPEGFFLNGAPVRLVGLDRHQSYPYVGYAMPARVQKKDADILRLDAGCNIVRTSHYPQSHHFLDRCDELGLLVMEELPGWQHIGDAAWQAHSVQDVADMITRDFNHPSIILWGVRINESQDNHDFYTKTNDLSRSMDPTRQTGGTRYIQKSELLEDVYTYNDFTHSGGAAVFRPQGETTGLDHSVPTLVTESNGHMYPTKRFDQEARVVEHALRHLRVIDASMGQADIAGGLSWCAFDYNTHGCFGSGDKICYHGVYDMFRNPKYAAFAYAAQKAPEAGPVLEPLTVASRGERDGGGMVPFQVLTNCDAVRVHKNGAIVGDFTPDFDQYPHLAHPPVKVPYLLERDTDLGFSAEDDKAFRAYLAKTLGSGTLTNLSGEDFKYIGGLAAKYGKTIPQLFGTIAKVAGGWGDVENDLLLEGILDGKVVISRAIGEHKSAAGIVLQPDDSLLCCGGDTYDATRIIVKAVDNMGNLMPFTQDCVELTLQGPAQVMGPTRFALTGGISAFWVRTTGTAGTVKICARSMYETAECTLQVQS